MTRRWRRPLRIMSKAWTRSAWRLIHNVFRHSVVGGPETVKKGVADFIARYRPDEIIVTAQIFDHAARLQIVRDTQPRLRSAHAA